MIQTEGSVYGPEGTVLGVEVKIVVPLEDIRGSSSPLDLIHQHDIVQQISEAIYGSVGHLNIWEAVDVKKDDEKKSGPKMGKDKDGKDCVCPDDDKKNGKDDKDSKKGNLPPWLNKKKKEENTDPVEAAVDELLGD